jgi:hypothetical protein
MSSATRLSPYPLEALHKRERWRLDALRLELVAAATELAASGARHEALVRDARAAAAAASPAPRSVIDPAHARRHLLHLAALQVRAANAAQDLATHDASCARLREASRAQQIRLESIDRHRADFQRTAAADAERRHGVESEREWLARSEWKKRVASSDATCAEVAARRFSEART